MAAFAPFCPPIGERMPDTPYSVTASMPTWKSVQDWARREPDMIKIMKTGYPRFFITAPVRNLGAAALQRVGVPHDSNINTMTFVNGASAARFVEALNMQNPDKYPLEIIQFSLPDEAKVPAADARWLSFYTALYPASLDKQAKAYWRDSGDGISSRHALFCFDRLEYLQSSSLKSSYCTAAPKAINEQYPPTPLHTTGATEASNLKSFIANLATSERPNEPSVVAENVFLYPRGMSAIYAVSRALASMERPSETVAYGWLYAETLKLLQRNDWDKLVFYGHGRAEDLDELEASLAGGRRIQALFCEFPGNPLLVAPDLKRIGELARRHDFIVACDDTVATFVNVDLFPDVDILMTSLTKMFSGGNDVMGGSVVINPKSRYYNIIYSRLAEIYEDTIFPLDSVVLESNSKDFVQRVLDSNENGRVVAEYLAKHPSVAELRYPSMVSTAPLFEQYRRRNGGYGHLLSVVFHEERDAITFYNSLNVCKGTSFGTIFCLAIPYVQLAHYWEQDWVECYGVSRHIVRLSVGLENQDEILKTCARALQKVEENKPN